MSARDMCEHSRVTDERVRHGSTGARRSGVCGGPSGPSAAGCCASRCRGSWASGCRAREHLPARGGRPGGREPPGRHRPAGRSGWRARRGPPSTWRWRATSRTGRSRRCCSRSAPSRCRPASPTRGRCATRANQLEAGRLVVIFPEGAPTWGPELAEFREGVGHLALTPGVTVVPVALWGTHRVLRGWRPVGRGPVRVAFGPPVPVPAEGTRRERATAPDRRRPRRDRRRCSTRWCGQRP